MEKEMSASERMLESGSIRKTIWAYGIPCMFSMLITTLYNIVDQVFIGQGVGYLGNSATNVIFPLTTIGLSLGLLVGSGCAAMFSVLIGRGDRNRAAKCIGNAFSLLIVIGIIYTIVTSLLLPKIVIWFGATELVYDYAMDYGRIICFGFAFYLISIGLGHMLRADGRPAIGTWATLAGCVTNVILDPISIFILGMGVKGAAWSTDIGILISLVIEVTAILRPKTVYLTKSDFYINPVLCLRIMSHGLVDFALNLGVTIIFVVNNNLLTSYGALSIYGSEIPLATYGIMQKIDHIITSVATGMAQGAQPVIGYSYGRGNKKRVREAMRFALIQGCVIGMSLEALTLIFAHPILSLFGSESELYMEFGVRCIRTFMSLAFMFAIQTTSSNICMALGSAGKGAILAFLRNALVPSVAGIVLCQAIGVDGVLFEGPISGITGLVLAALFMSQEWKKFS